MHYGRRREMTRADRIALPRATTLSPHWGNGGESCKALWLDRDSCIASLARHGDHWGIP